MKIKNVEAMKAEESKKADGADNEKKPLKLPEASYTEIDDYDITDAPKRSSTYFRFIEKSPEELVNNFKLHTTCTNKTDYFCAVLVVFFLL